MHSRRSPTSDDELNFKEQPNCGYHPTTNSYHDPYHHLRRKYEKAGGILYKQSILSPDECKIVLNDLDSLQLKLTAEKESSFATNRIGAQISNGSDIYRVLGDKEGSLYQLINALAGSCENNVRGQGADSIDGENEAGEFVLAPDVPIELRVYEKAGAGMEWHIDDVIYQPEQIEVVLTLENSSDCCTMWRPHDQPMHPQAEESFENFNKLHNQPENGANKIKKVKGAKPNANNLHPPKYKVESVQTTPNSALILRAGSVEHKVSPLKAGRRVILKMAFVREGALMDEGMSGHVTHHGKNGGKQRCKLKKGRKKR